MSPDEGFAVLGLRPGASLDEVRAARKRLAKQHHPDAGGDERAMRRVNQAFDVCVKAVLRPTAPTPPAAPPTRRPPTPSTPPPSTPPTRHAPSGPRRGGRAGRWVERDDATFVIEALPVEAFHALEQAAGRIGVVVDDDPPYLLDVHVNPPFECLCRLTLMPEAGASTVSISVAHLTGAAVPGPTVDDLCPLWIESLRFPN